MSGLGVFFFSSRKSTSTTTAAVAVGTKKNTAAGRAIEFSTSLVDIPVTSSTSAVLPTTTADTFFSTRSLGTYRDYKEHYNDLLSEYLDQRVIEATEETMNKKDHEKNRVPHIAETLHRDVKYIMDMDLYTQTASLELLQASKLCKFRSTRRHAVKHAYSDTERPIVEQSSEILPQLYLEYTVYDGPLGTVYRDVLNFEVEQCWVQVPQSRQIMTDQENIKHPKRMPIYFYNKYASLLHKCWDQKFSNKQSAATLQTFVAVENLPAKCIFPTTFRDWYDRQTLASCHIAIGDESSISISTQGEDSTSACIEKLRFDSDDLVVRIAFREFDGKWTEYCIRSINGKVKLEESVKDQKLKDLYQLWEKEQKTTTDASQMPDTPQLPRDQVMHGALELSTLPTQQLETQLDSAVSAPATTQDTSEEFTDIPSRMVATNDENSQPVDDSQSSSQKSTTDSQKDTSTGLSSAPPATAHSNLDYFPVPRDQTLKDGIIRYHKLGELQDLFDSSSDFPDASIYGVVLAFGAPTQTKIGSWMINVSLIDDSLPLETEPGQVSVRRVSSISTNIFCKHKEDLPTLLYAGDVLRIHRAKVETYKGELQLCGKTKASYVVFRGDNENLASHHWKIIPTSKVGYKLTDSDKQRFIQLWQWGALRLFKEPTMRDENKVYLSGLKRQEDEDQLDTRPTGIDMTVMICAIITVPPEQRTNVSPRGFLRVWDGTGPPICDPFPQRYQQFFFSIPEGPPAEAVETISLLISRLKKLASSPNIEFDIDMVAPTALAGRVANVTIWEEEHWNILQATCSVGSFLRLRNVYDQKTMDVGARSIVVHLKSQLTPLPTLTHEIVLLLRDHDARLRRNEQLNPSSGVLPLRADEVEAAIKMDLEDASRNDEPATQDPGIANAVHPTSLSELKLAEIGAEFVGEVCFTAPIPSIQRLLASGLSSICQPDDESGELVYRFGVHVVDARGEGLTFIVNEASGIGDTLFGMSAQEASTNSSTALHNLSQVLESRRFFKVRVRVVTFNNQKWFYLDEILL